LNFFWILGAIAKPAQQLSCTLSHNANRHAYVKTKKSDFTEAEAIAQAWIVNLNSQFAADVEELAVCEIPTRAGISPSAAVIPGSRGHEPLPAAVASRGRLRNGRSQKQGVIHNPVRSPTRSSV
jgi:hypothetical protein